MRHACDRMRACGDCRRAPLALLLAVPLLGALLLLPACDGGSSVHTKATPGVSSSTAGATTGAAGQATATSGPVTVSTPGAAQGTAGLCSQPASVSAQPPASVPTYPGAALRIGQSQNGAGLFGFCSSAAVATIASFYTAELPAAGWQNVTHSTIDTTEQFAATRGSGRVIITILPDSQLAGMTDIVVATSGI